MNTITLRNLYTINLGWTNKRMLFVFFEQEEAYELMTAKEALEKYGKCTVDYFNGNTVVLKERLG